MKYTISADPYKYKHTYRIQLEKRLVRTSTLYPMHCDYPNPRDKRNIKELRRRILWSMDGCRIEHIQTTKSKLLLNK